MHRFFQPKFELVCVRRRKTRLSTPPSRSAFIKSKLIFTSEQICQGGRFVSSRTRLRWKWKTFQPLSLSLPWLMKGFSPSSSLFHAIEFSESGFLARCKRGPKFYFEPPFEGELICVHFQMGKKSSSPSSTSSRCLLFADALRSVSSFLPPRLGKDIFALHPGRLHYKVR